MVVKVFHNNCDPNHDIEFRKRLDHEFRTGTLAANPNVARVLHADADGPIPFLVSEYIDGPNLGALVGHRGPLDETTTELVAAGIRAGHAACH